MSGQGTLTSRESQIFHKVPILVVFVVLLRPEASAVAQTP